jgi:hypothetical protein
LKPAGRQCQGREQGTAAALHWISGRQGSGKLARTRLRSPSPGDLHAVAQPQSAVGLAIGRHVLVGCPDTVKPSGRSIGRLLGWNEGSAGFHV